MKRLAITSLVVSAYVGVAMPAVGAELSGREVFDHYCSACHGSEDGPGTVQLSRTRGSDRALLIERTDLAPDYIEYIVRHGLRSMPAFVPSDLTDARLKALIAFLTKKPSADGIVAPSVRNGL
jgi:mono/diheme cytochrome c family protein